jgi:hypothetical protein
MLQYESKSKLNFGLRKQFPNASVFSVPHVVQAVKIIFRRVLSGGYGVPYVNTVIR